MVAAVLMVLMIETRVIAKIPAEMYQKIAPPSYSRLRHDSSFGSPHDTFVAKMTSTRGDFPIGSLDEF